MIDVGHSGGIVIFRAFGLGFFSGLYYSSTWGAIVKTWAASSLATRLTAAIFHEVAFLATIEAFVVLLPAVLFSI